MPDPRRTQWLSLAGAWQLAGFDGYGENIGGSALPGAFENFSWLAGTVPGSVYRDLEHAGWIGDVRTGLNSLAARWVEHWFWFYRRTFEAPQVPAGGRCELVVDGVDLDALVYLNGTCVGAHANAFRPCRVDLTPHLRPGANELLIRVDSGFLAALDRPQLPYQLEVTAVHTRRAYLRKPQYGARWDWAPRLMNVGIGGPVGLEITPVARLAEVVVTPELADDRGSARVHVRCRVASVGPRTQRLTVRVRIPALDVVAETVADVPAGEAELACTLECARPQLWWPRGYGAQPLYELEAELLQAGAQLDTARRTFGFRSVALRQPPAADGGRLFHLVVNGEPIFCKGANWVPADLLYATVAPADYEQLVALAAECNCNLLRVWGGGHYATPAFLAACDRAGLLVWHDFIFACARYPYDDPVFAAEVEAEARHVVRALAHHPSLAVWCGNNEVELGIRDGWLGSTTPDRVPCRRLFHERLGEIVAAEDGSRPYWPTSPWSPDDLHPNDMRSGDQHPWLVSLGPVKGDYWAYRHDSSRFPNEGGMLGPSTPATLAEILPPAERRLDSRTWRHHDNTQNTWRAEPLLDHLLRTHLSLAPRALTFDEYTRYAALLHGEALETAIDNWRRRKFDTSAAIFWMFNDTWPAVVSWTPLDYCRRRKPAFWYVRRAFADLRVICVELPREVAYFVVNDTRSPQECALRYGFFGLGGGLPVDERCQVHVPANGSVRAAVRPLREWDALGVASHGAFAVLTDAAGAASSHRLFRERFGRLAWHAAEVEVMRTAGGLRLRADTFAWAVCLDERGERPLADNYFDLLPGIPRDLAWADAAPPVVRGANPPPHVCAPPGA